MSTTDNTLGILHILETYTQYMRYSSFICYPYLQLTYPYPFNQSVPLPAFETHWINDYGNQIADAEVPESEGVDLGDDVDDFYPDIQYDDANVCILILYIYYCIFTFLIFYYTIILL